MSEYLLEMEDICKSFSGVVALDHVHFNLKAGEVHALMGENGAGKSTLMKILSGNYHADSGTIRINGQEVHMTNAHVAIAHGVGMVHQEMSNVPDMTVAENIFLGKEPNSGGMVDFKQMNTRAAELLAPLGFQHKTTDKIRSLTVSNQQLVEIAKALSQNAQIIILDEPTSSITESEVERLFKIIKDLKEQGVGIIYISHKMDEIFQICDRVTVLRDGEYINSSDIEEYNEDRLISELVGRSLDTIFPKEEAEITDTIFEVKNLKIDGLFEDISFSVRKGEILGFAGLVGAGRTEIMEAIFGTRRLDEGEIFLEGKKIQIKSPDQAIKRGIVYLSEDRKLKGINPEGAVYTNMSISALRQLSNAGVINQAKENAEVKEYIDKLSIKTPSPRKLIRNLSGGNQQKVIIARGMLTKPKVFILDEPTRGIDVGAKAEIHSLICKLAQQGMAVIIISSELPEVMGMSDRMAVVYEGHITGELMREEFDQEKIMAYASGITG